MAHLERSSGKTGSLAAFRWSDTIFSLESPILCKAGKKLLEKKSFHRESIALCVAALNENMLRQQRYEDFNH